MLFKCKICFKGKSDPHKSMYISFAMRAGSFNRVMNKLEDIVYFDLLGLSKEWKCKETRASVQFERDDIYYSHICTYSKAGGFKGDFITSPIYTAAREVA